MTDFKSFSPAHVQHDALMLSRGGHRDAFWTAVRYAVLDKHAGKEEWSAHWTRVAQELMRHGAHLREHTVCGPAEHHPRGLDDSFCPPGWHDRCLPVCRGGEVSDWETRLDALRQSLDKRARRIEQLRDQGLHELAEREDYATIGERRELASILAQMEREVAKPAPAAPSMGCHYCSGSGWLNYGGYPQPCPYCNGDASVPYSC